MGTREEWERGGIGTAQQGIGQGEWGTTEEGPGPEADGEEALALAARARLVLDVCELRHGRVVHRRGVGTLVGIAQGRHGVLAALFHLLLIPLLLLLPPPSSSSL
eukprot:494958-Pyramimonas_sp.AAC.1